MLTQDTPQRLIYCIHGFCRTFRSFYPVACYFRKHGWTPILFRYHSFRNNIRYYGKLLARFVRYHSSQYKVQSIGFFSHSLGGIITLSALSDDGCPEAARQGRGIFLGSPLRGAQIAKRLGHSPWTSWFFGKGPGWELVTSPSDGFESLLGHFPPHFQLMVISGDLGFLPIIPFPHDGKVTCEETRPFHHPHIYHRIHTGHSWMMWDFRIWRLTIDFLNASSKS